MNQKLLSENSFVFYELNNNSDNVIQGKRRLEPLTRVRLEKDRTLGEQRKRG